MEYILKVFFLGFVLCIIIFILGSCNNNDEKESYPASAFAKLNCIKMEDSKYVIFSLESEGSMAWPDSALLKYNDDSTKVKLTIFRFSAFNSKTKSTKKNIHLITKYPELDSLIKDPNFYVIKVSNSVTEVSIPGSFFKPKTCNCLPTAASKQRRNL